MARRFVALDGLRGIAALMVLLHHSSDSLIGANFPRSGYLAVDFFFMLSGFVLAAVYEPRFAAGMTFRPFAAARVRRLYPVMAAGILFGAVVIGLPAMSAREVALRLVAQLLFVPIIAGEPGIYPLDGVQWSLFFEFVANALHVLILWRLSNRRLGLLCLACLVLLFAAAWASADYRLGDRGENFVGGFPRALFPYTLGILLYRLRERLPSAQIHAATLFIALPAALIWLNAVRLVIEPWAADLLTVCLFFPPLIHFGSQARVGRLSAMSDAFGRLSYPLYAVHLPMLAAFMLLIPQKGVTLLILAIWWSVAGAHVLMRLSERGERAAARASKKGAPWWARPSFLRKEPIA